MGDLEAMTVAYTNKELAVKRGNLSVIWRAVVRSASPGTAGLSSIQTTF